MFATLISAAGEPGYLAACPAQQASIVFKSTPIAPDSIRPTNHLVKLLLDVGSDGKLRHASIIESSGDPVFDGAAIDAVKLSRFAPPTQGCISTSFVVPIDYSVPILTLARPAPNSSGVPVLASAAPESSLAICGTPFVQLTSLGFPEHRQVPGTADIDVGLNASAHVTSVKLAHSSGNAQTDAVATSAAHDAQFQFTLPPGCPPKPTIYRLQLTYH
jgi:TonB family protein